MRFETVNAMLKGVPFISEVKARILYDFIIRTKRQHCLELGHAHGVSSCYIAAALDEIGSGQLTTVDLVDSEARQPNIEYLLCKTNLSQYVDVVREKNSYTWFLKKRIEKNTTNYNCDPEYDFCYIDGPKNWTIDGLAFFLVDKLMKQDGWILFDDYNWTYKWSGQEETDGISNRNLSLDELEQPHIEKIFQLLVMQHPSYSEFKLQDDAWAWAHKVKLPKRNLSLYTTYGFLDLCKLVTRRVFRKVFHATFR